jgi:transposase
MKRHRHQEFIRFLNEVVRTFPSERRSTRSSTTMPRTGTKVRKWVTQHLRWTFHFTPISASWLNAVEGFFAKLTNRRLKRGVFRSVAVPQASGDGGQP